MQNAFLRTNMDNHREKNYRFPNSISTKTRTSTTKTDCTQGIQSVCHFESSALLRYDAVSGENVLDVSKERSVFIFKGQAVQDDCYCTSQLVWWLLFRSSRPSMTCNYTCWQNGVARLWVAYGGKPRTADKRRSSTYGAGCNIMPLHPKIVPLRNIKNVLQTGENTLALTGGRIQNFSNSLLEPRMASTTVLWSRYLISHSSQVCSHNPLLCSLSRRVCIVVCVKCDSRFPYGWHQDYVRRKRGKSDRIPRTYTVLGGRSEDIFHQEFVPCRLNCSTKGFATSEEVSPP